MITRLEDWQALLGDALLDAGEKRFARGEWDCATGACSIVERMTGVDLAADLRGRYDSRETAEILFAELYDQASLEAACDVIAAKHEIEEVPVPFAQRGDLVLLSTERGPSLGVVDLTGRSAVFIAPRGLTRHPVRDCFRAWRV